MPEETSAQKRVDEFLDLYKQMEDALEEKYRNARRRYSSVVIEFSKDYESAPVRDKLEICREIRNLLTHSANLGGEPVAEPSYQVVEAMREILAFIKRPPLAIEYATKGEQIMKAELDRKVLRLMEVMDKNGYSHIPVTDGGSFYGVFSAGSLFRYQLRNRGRAINEGTTLRELSRDLKIGEHLENYVFMPRSATYISARKAFESVKAKHQRVSVIFITENGLPGEQLLGMLTPWDVLGEP